MRVIAGQAKGTKLTGIKCNQIRPTLDQVREALFNILRSKYNIQGIYDPCSYPGIQCKFYYDNTLSEQNGQQPKHKDYQEISFMIFRTGSVLVFGKCDEDVLHEIYRFIKKILESEYRNISCITENNTVAQNNKQRKKKIRKKNILMN